MKGREGQGRKGEGRGEEAPGLGGVMLVCKPSPLMAGLRERATDPGGGGAAAGV